MFTARPATPADAEAIARIYNEGIHDRVGTFETRERTPDDVRQWFDGRHPIVVVERAGAIAAFAATSSYRARDCYAGVAEFSVYVSRDARGMGAGWVAMDAIIAAARDAGLWKLLSRVFVENDRLKMDLGRAKVVELPREETERRWNETTYQWPIMHAVTYSVSRDELMAKHKSNHIHVAYANSAAEADKALIAKAAMAEALGLDVNVCGTRAGGKSWTSAKR